ncbi:MAG: GNAT family N-acetyltransferase [Bacillota bacterium]
MGLNEYRDQAGAFLRRIGAFDDDLSVVVAFLDEELTILKHSLDQDDRLCHQVYDLLFLLFELAAKKGFDIDREWLNGAARKAAKYPSPTSVESQMETSLLIRPFLPRDQASARALILSGLGEHFGFVDYSMNPDLDDIASSYPDGCCTFLVAEVCERLVGTGALVPEGTDDGRIVRMSVCPTHRRRGIGRMMVQRLLAAAKTSGYRRVWIETNRDWYAAISMYESCGFSIHHDDGQSVHMYVSLGGTDR